MAAASAVEALETSLLLEAIFQRFGNDFRHHNREQVLQTLRSFMQTHSVATLSALQEKILHDAAFIEPVLCALDTRSLGLFDYPEQIMKMRKVLVPWLRSCPAPKIWITECVSAEDVYAWVILLVEENLYQKTQVYVTGRNGSLLADARQGKFPTNRFAQYERNYARAGGAHRLAEYCFQVGDYFIFNPGFGRNITWAQYDLGTDASFNEFEAIICCGGLSNFTLHLRHRAVKIFYESQPVFGLLTMTGETPVDISPFNSRYNIISEKYGLYQRGR
jgi:chemotaxis protein methyltransferase CheR